MVIGGSAKRAAAACMVSVMFISLAVLAWEKDAAASCLKGVVGEMMREVDTEVSDQPILVWDQPALAEFGEGEKAWVELAVIPFDEGFTNIRLNNGINSYVNLSFMGDGNTDVGLTYEPGKWNNVRIVADYDTFTYSVRINGTESSPQDFVFDSTDTQLTSFRVVSIADTGADPSAKAYIDTIQVKKMTPSGSTLITSQGFAGAYQQPDQGSMTDVPAPTTEGADGGACPTSISLSIAKSSVLVTARGRVLPAHSGDFVVVKMFVKRPSGFVQVDKIKTQLDDESRYFTTFQRRDKKTCKMQAKFPTDGDHKASAISKKFAC